MSHKQAKSQRKVVRKEWRVIRDRLIEQIREMPLMERVKLFWRLLDTSPRTGIRILKRPMYAFIESPKKWGLVCRLEKSWWVWDGNPMDTQNKGRDGWGVTICGVRIDWRKEWTPSKSKAQIRRSSILAWAMLGAVAFAGLITWLLLGGVV